MGNITKHPHYVYRKYLRAWSKNEKINCLIDNKKIINTNLMNIGQENNFYEFPLCTYEEIEIGMYIANNNCKDLMALYQQVNDRLKASDNQRKEMLDFAKQSEEKFFNCMVEDRLNIFLEKLYKCDFSFLDITSDSMQFFHAIAEQYCRTKKIKENTKELFRKMNHPNINGDHIWILIRHSIAFKIGLSLYNDKYQVCLLKSHENNFITSDQPAINFHGDFKEIPDEFELYYPISPELALIISKQHKYPNKSVMTIDKKEVEKWNDLIASMSYNQVYSHKKELLKKY